MALQEVLLTLPVSAVARLLSSHDLKVGGLLQFILTTMVTSWAGVLFKPCRR